MPKFSIAMPVLGLSTFFLSALPMPESFVILSMISLASLSALFIVLSGFFGIVLISNLPISASTLLIFMLGLLVFFVMFVILMPDLLVLFLSILLIFLPEFLDIMLISDLSAFTFVLLISLPNLLTFFAVSAVVVPILDLSAFSISGPFIFVTSLFTIFFVFAILIPSFFTFFY